MAHFISLGEQITQLEAYILLGIGTVQLEGTFKDHLAQLPDLHGDNQKLKHIIEGTAQLPLEH